MDETRRSTPPRPDPPRSEVGEHGVSSPADVRRPSGDGTGPAADLRPELETPLPSPPRLPRRGLRRLVLPVLVLVLVGAAAAGVWYWRENLGIVRTDNAQTAGDLAPVSSRVPGTVIRVDVTDNQFVRAGTVLVELDPTDYRLALDQAKAQLTAAQAQVQASRAAFAAQEQEYLATLRAARAAVEAARPQLPQAEAQLALQETQAASQIAQARARVTSAEAEVRAARAALDLARKTVDRDRLLYADGAIAAQQVESDTTQLAAAQARYQSAEDALREARADLAIAEASRHQVTIARETVAISQGQVARAQAELQQAEAGEALVRQRAHDLAVAEAQAAAAEAAVRTAEVNLARTRIVAPSDGWVTNRTVQVGQVVQPNQPLLFLTLAHHVWVVANIKETQLGSIRVGDPVRITVDALRGRVFHGHVESIGAATGSATALLPPDNATGNFIKVVQLVPVRIALDRIPGIDPAQQLPIGLSVEVAIDTRHHPR
jgi:membrane fusion protein (multidrug efflux system)